MKKQFVFLVLIFVVTTNLLSQNWKPLNLSVKYNYQIDTADYITNTLWIDSLEVIEGDSVFYFNRIMIINPTNNYYAYKNQPQFLMRKMLKESDSIYIFSDTTEFVIKPLENYTDTWIFNEENAVSAEITTETEEEIFGQLDSVKIISLSDGRSIKISKNFGILEFFDWETDAVYNLAGVEGNQEFGEQVPDFWDFYNFQIDDIIERSESDFRIVDGLTVLSHTGFEKFTINSVEANSNEVICEISGLYYVYGEDYEGYYSHAGYFNRSDTYTYINTSISNNYNHELIQLNEYFEMEDEIPFYRNLETSLENDLYIKKVDAGVSLNESILYINSGTNENLLIGVYFLDYAKIKYTETLGMTEYHNALLLDGDGSYDIHNELLGYIRDGITYGTVHPDSWYINYMDVENIDNKLKIYPNPTTNFINIVLPENDSQELIIEIYDFTGKQVLHIQTQNRDQQINVSGLKSGLYFITVKSDKNIYKTKFVKN